MNLRESKFCKRLTDVLYRQCAFIFNVHGHGMQRRGIPDLHIIHRKWYGYLELKCQKNKTSDIQKSVAKKIVARNYPCFVFRSVDSEFDSMGNAIGWQYQLEDFSGAVVAKVNGLGKLLNVLIYLRDK